MERVGSSGALRMLFMKATGRVGHSVGNTAEQNDVFLFGNIKIST